MPWKEMSVMESREEFCALAQQEGRRMRELCRRYGISPTTGYTWLRRYQAEGRDGLSDRSRRPQSSPRRTGASTEEAVLALRRAHPSWGGRKLRARLRALGTSPPVPSARTITAILRRHDLVDPAESGRHRAFLRFEAAQPNALWQMDFKGHVPLSRRGRCHPLTVLDDHSRFALGLVALGNEQIQSVQPALEQLFRRYGLPNRILCDNTGPWGETAGRWGLTVLGVWLLRLDVVPIHGRPYHPQTQGKEERFHRTLKAEVLRRQSFATLGEAQDAFDAWRHCYNHERPHEALGLAPPSTRYHASPRSYPAQLPPVEYAPGELVRRVRLRGDISLHGRRYFIGEALRGYPIALRPKGDGGLHHVYFRHYAVGLIDLDAPIQP